MIRVTGVTRRYFVAMIVVSVSVSVISCAHANPPGVTDARRRDDEQLHQQLLQEATEGYTLGDPTLPTDSDVLPISTDNPQTNIQIFAFAMRKNGLIVPESPRFVAAFLSTKEYGRMHIRKGMNYVLKLTSGGKTAFVLVPDKDNAKMYFLKTVDVENDVHGNPPHAVRKEVSRTTNSTGEILVNYVIGGCIDNCGSGHCGTSDAGLVFTGADAQAWNVKLDGR